MAQDFTVQVQGLKELDDLLLSLPANLAKRVVRESLQDAGAVIQQEMGVLAPRNTGLLGSSEGIGVSVKLSSKHDEGTVSIGPTKKAFYGTFQELGWTDKAGVFHAGRPFMRPAIANKAKEALEAMIIVIRRGVAELAGKKQ